MSIVFDSTTTGIFIRLLLAVGKRTSAILARVGPTGYLVSHDRNLAPRERASFLFASHCLDDISIYRLCQVKIPEPRQTAGRNVRRKMRRKMQDQTHQGCLRTRTDRNTDISPLEEGRERPHLGGFEKKRCPAHLIHTRGSLSRGPLIKEDEMAERSPYFLCSSTVCWRGCSIYVYVYVYVRLVILHPMCLT